MCVYVRAHVRSRALARVCATDNRYRRLLFRIWCVSDVVGLRLGRVLSCSRNGRQAHTGPEPRADLYTDAEPE